MLKIIRPVLDILVGLLILPFSLLFLICVSIAVLLVRYQDEIKLICIIGLLVIITYYVGVTYVK